MLFSLKGYLNLLPLAQILFTNKAQKYRAIKSILTRIFEIKDDIIVAREISLLLATSV